MTERHAIEDDRVPCPVCEQTRREWILGTPREMVVTVTRADLCDVHAAMVTVAPDVRGGQVG